jgi:hypothetical protein
VSVKRGEGARQCRGCLEFERNPDCTRAPLAALQRRYLRQPNALRMKLNAFPTVVSNPGWHIGCTAGARQQPNN